MIEKNRTVIPRKATTIILLRDRERDGFEVFLLRRHEQNVFMGGNFVYPGGRVDKVDGDADIIPYCTGVSSGQAMQILGEAEPGEPSLAYWVAGLRELYEEAGILLARDKAGLMLSCESTDVRDRFALHRRHLQKREKTLVEILKEEGLTLAVDGLFYYAHWLTPEARNVRFDTRFFIARNAPGQEASPDNRETTEGIWVTPAQALQENQDGTVALSPPTLKTLEDLSRFGTSDELLAAVPGLKKPLILPVLLNPLASEILIFPWDPGYKESAQGGLNQPVDHGSPSGPHDNTTRLVLQDGRWLPYHKNKG